MGEIVMSKISNENEDYFVEDIMVARLLSYAILIYTRVVPETEYKENLHAYFLKDPNNSLLLELEWRTSDIQYSINVIIDYARKNDVDYDTFGGFLISKLEEIYYQDDMDIKYFGSKMYLVWSELPSEIQNKEPFRILCYADDPLSWEDENQSREIYQRMFYYYK